MEHSRICDQVAKVLYLYAVTLCFCRAIDDGENPDKHIYKICKDMQLFQSVSSTRTELFKKLADAL